MKNTFSSQLRVKNNENLSKISSELLDAVDNSKFYKSLNPIEQKSLKKRVFSEDLQEVFRSENKPDFEPSKSPKEIFYHFFGMNENWKWGRNILGMVMVHCPEYPTYFIPTYSQTKETGNCGHVKKGEKFRGLLTGGLEGLAVGALVSGAKLKGKEMVPYIVLGAGLQLLSSMLFPWLGEVTGKQVYKKKVASGEIDPSKVSFKALGAGNLHDPDNPIKPDNPDNPKKPPAFSGRIPYNNVYSSRLKI